MLKPTFKFLYPIIKSIETNTIDANELNIVMFSIV